jgi:adenylate kinase
MILMGPPGAGKGTQAKLLERQFQVPHVSSGDLLRDAIKQQTAMGLEAKHFMDRGELVPDPLLLAVIEARLREADCQGGFILDGFPRTLPQAETLCTMLKAAGQKINCVTSLRVPTEDLVRRLSGRRTCPDCGAMYHVTLNPPAAPGRCDRCGGQLSQRDDDREETVVARMGVYERQTAPVLAAYRKCGLLREVDGVGSQQQVFERILAAAQGTT